MKKHEYLNGTWRRAATALIVIGTLFASLQGCEGDASDVYTTGLDGDQAVKRFEYDAPEQVEELAISLNYTPEAWQAGIREVPRLYITKVPPRWRDKTSDEMQVVDKKRAFFRLLGPLVLRVNELIESDRQQLQSIVEALRAGKTTGSKDQAFLRETAMAYKVAKDEAELDVTNPAL